MMKHRQAKNAMALQSRAIKNVQNLREGVRNLISFRPLSETLEISSSFRDQLQNFLLIRGKISAILNVEEITEIYSKISSEFL